MKMKNIQINRALLPMKAHYFLWNAGTGPIVPFLSVYARQLGFSSVIVGVVYTILPLCGMIAKPLFGGISDRYHCQKKIFLCAQILTAVAFLAIYYSPKLDFNRRVHLSCDGVTVFNSLPGAVVDDDVLNQIQNTESLDLCQLKCGDMQDSDWTAVCNDWGVTKYCNLSTSNKFDFIAHVPTSQTIGFDNNTVIFRVANVTIDNERYLSTCVNNKISTTCDLLCANENINTIVTQTKLTDSDIYGMYQFWVFLLLMIAGWVSQAISVSIGDAICFELLGEKHNRYGYQRMFGALGWGIASTIAGVMIDALSRGKPESDYMSAFYMGAAFLIVDFMVSTKIQYSQTKMSTSIVKDVSQLLLNKRIIVFILWCICVGMCTGLIWNFLLWLVEDLARKQGGSTLSLVKTLQGILMGVQCLGGELPFFFLSGKILKKIGHVNAMSLVLFAIGIRFVLYSFIANPWYFIPIELSNGLTFGLFYACMASYASIVAPPGTEATMQGMVGAVFEGVGVSLGSLLGGISFNLTSESGLTFRYFGFGALAACLIHIAVQFLLRFEGNESFDGETCKENYVKKDDLVNNSDGVPEISVPCSTRF